MTDLTAHGIDVTLPTGWEGRLFRRPLEGEVAVAGRQHRGRTGRATGDDERGAARVDDRGAARGGRLRQRRGRQARRRRRVRRAVRVRPLERRHRAVQERGHPAPAGRRRLQPQRHAARHPRPGRRAEVLQRPGSCVLPVRGHRFVRSPQGARPAGQRGAGVTRDRAARGPDHDIEHHDHDRAVEHGADHRGTDDRGADARPRRAAKDRERPRRSVRDRGRAARRRRCGEGRATTRHRARAQRGRREVPACSCPGASPSASAVRSRWSSAPPP